MERDALEGDPILAEMQEFWWYYEHRPCYFEDGGSWRHVALGRLQRANSSWVSISSPVIYCNNSLSDVRSKDSMSFEALSKVRKHWAESSARLQLPLE